MSPTITDIFTLCTRLMEQIPSKQIQPSDNASYFFQQQIMSNTYVNKVNKNKFFPPRNTVFTKRKTPTLIITEPSKQSVEGTRKLDERMKQSHALLTFAHKFNLSLLRNNVKRANDVSLGRAWISFSHSLIFCDEFVVPELCRQVFSQLNV